MNAHAAFIRSFDQKRLSKYFDGFDEAVGRGATAWGFTGFGWEGSAAAVFAGALGWEVGCALGDVGVASSSSVGRALSVATGGGVSGGGVAVAGTVVTVGAMVAATAAVVVVDAVMVAGRPDAAAAMDRSACWPRERA